MAVTYNGCKNSLSSSQKPSGYTDPVVSEITSPEYTNTKTFTVLKATVENATASTTMTNIFDNVTIGLDKQIEDDITADYDATKTVTAYADLTTLTTNFAGMSATGDWLKATAVSYTATVIVYVNVA